MGGGSTTVEAPKPSAEELEIQREQLEVLREQRADQAKLRPALLLSMGYEEKDGKLVPTKAEEAELAFEQTLREKQMASYGYKYDPESGETKRLTEDEIKDQMTSTEKQAYDLRKAFQEKALKAVKGELPVSDALEQELKEQENTLREALKRRLGSNYEDTTPGIQALDKFDKRREQLREGARTAAMSQYEQLALARGGQIAGLQQYRQQALGQQQAQRYSTLQQYYGKPSSFGQYAQVLQPYQFQRNLEYQASAANAQAAAQRSAGMWGGVGSLVGTAIGAYAA